MATHVYANDLEIACKSTDGTATPAFPDPCWSPPAPSAGPIVIPYPNTAFAPDITNGTTTVFIHSKTVAIEDKAYFSRSTGNEPATQAFAKGVQTGIITGKAYFRNWSLDVVFEGLGVDRHTDMVSHNHASMPANTPLFPYISRSFFSSNPCKREQDTIERACEKEADQSDTRRGLRKGNKGLSLLKRKGGKKGAGSGGHWHWTDDHCDGLNVNLNSYAKAREYADQMQKAYQELPGMIDFMGALESELKEMATRAGAKALGKWALKAGGKQLVGSSLPLVGNVLMGIWSAADAAIAIGDINEIRRVATESLRQLDVLKSKSNDLLNLSKRFENLDQLSDQDALELVSDGQDALATLNPCTRARKCNLVPKSAKDGSRNVEPADSGGCCPGQTGHHLIYGAMMEGVACGDTKYSTAPTVCAEGASQHHGSHGRVHDAMDGNIGVLARNGKLDNGTMSMAQAIDAAADSHAEAFPLSRCSKKCIRAQLESYYDCPGARPKAVDKMGNPQAPDEGGNSDD